MPTIKDMHPVDPILTNVSIGYSNGGFVAKEIFPAIPVAEISGTYFIYNKGNRFGLSDARRAPKSGYNRIDWELSTDTFKCIKYGLEEVIDDDERRIAKSPLNLNVDTTEIVTDRMLLAAEKRVADIVTSTTTMTSNTTLVGNDKWSAYNTSDPIKDIEAGKTAVSNAIGQEANKMILSKDAFDKLKWHPAILSKIQYVQRAVVTTDLLAAIFGFAEVRVASSLYNSAGKGLTPSLSRLWGKDVLIAYVEKSVGLKKISLGYTMQFEGLQTISPFRDDKNIGDVIRVTEWVDEKLVSADCAYLIKNAVV